MAVVQDMERVSVQLTAETKAQIRKWADDAGVKPGYFMSMALTIGARQLARNLHPEQFMGPEVWTAIATAMGVEPEQLQQAVAQAECQKKAA